MATPLLPITIEGLMTGSTSDKSMTLTTAMYALSIGRSSQSVLMFFVTLTIGIIFSMVFGYTAAEYSVGQANLAGGPTNPTPNQSSQVWFYAFWSVVFIFIVHAMERYNRHVVDREPYTRFL